MPTQALTLLLLLTASLIAHAQTPASPKSHNTVLKVIDRVNELISAEKGEARDFEALQELFLASCRFMVVNPDPEAEDPVEMIDLAGFIELMHDPYYEKGYYETSLHEIIEEYSVIAHAFQTFYGKDSEGEEARGINSIQLVYIDERWWISSMLWTIETPDTPIPQEYISE